MNISAGIKSALLLLVCGSCALSAFAADTISGRVRNQTTGRAAAGDEVILLRLQNGMEEESKTRTDAAGAFSLSLSAADLPHVVRVVHQGVNYDQTASGKELNIAVFDAVPHIRGLQGNLGIAQVESDGEMLKVTEMYSISNDTVPPVTQSGPRNFEISITPKATLDSLVVKRGGGVWVNLAPTPIKGQDGRYAVDFPIRPGDTLFKYVYHLPYSEPTRLQVKLPYPIRNFAVMHPPSMVFKPSSARAFTSPGMAQGLRVEQAVVKPVVRAVPEFEVSGIGMAARAASPSLPTSPAAASPKPDTPASATLPVVPGRPEDRVWIILSGIAALLTAIAYAVWRKRKRAV